MAKIWQSAEFIRTNPSRRFVTLDFIAGKLQKVVEYSGYPIYQMKFNKCIYNHKFIDILRFLGLSCKKLMSNKF